MAQGPTNLSGLNVLLGVSGGIAAYKAVDLASKLTAAGAVVKTVMTKSACELIGPKSFEAVTNSQVTTSLWQKGCEYKISHVQLEQWADIVVVAPATANIIGKVANGICDDLLSSVLCVSWARPKLLAPAMNDNMWNNPAVQRNVQQVSDMGYKLIGPRQGRLASGKKAIGRMAEPEDILKAIGKIASQIKRNKK